MYTTSISDLQSGNSPASARKTQPRKKIDKPPGWYWRTPEGQALMESLKHIGPDPLDDPSFDDRGEED